ncbi:MAG: PAS domain S-box protein [Candidatus Riflebacteria bacterium]|nr:PAS domain S-box protein [Candidatus Riflebacteria bacterium]
METLPHQAFQPVFLDFLRCFPILVYEWDVEQKRYLSMNPFGCAFHGKSAAQIRRLSALEAATLIHPDDLGWLNEARQRLGREVAAGRPPSFIPVELRRRAPDGSFGWFLTWETLVRRAPDGPPTLLGFGQDISRRKRVEAALAESESNLRLILENMADVIWVCDLQMRFTFVTPSVSRLTGFTPEEVIGMGPLLTLTAEAVEVVSAALTEELAREAACPGTGGYRRFIIEQNRKGGGTVWTEVSTSFLRDPAGQVVAVAGVTRDFTAQRAVEEELRRSLGTLEERVVARTAELREANQRLEREIEERRRAQREALLAVEQERQHLGQDLHDDLCQRLVGAMCLAKSLDAPTLRKREPALAESVATIHGILGQTVELVRGLARGLAIKPSGVGALEESLRQLAQDSRRYYQVSCRVTVTGEIPALPPPVAVGLVRIAQEAITNAVRHGRATGLRISLRVAGSRLRLDLADNGGGITGDPKAMNGLGLRNMRSRAEFLRGTLQIGPRRGGGTRVRCEIPCPGRVVRKAAR